MDYLKKIKKIMNQCIAKKWIERSPFIGFMMSLNETHKTFLMLGHKSLKMTQHYAKIMISS